MSDRSWRSNPSGWLRQYWLVIAVVIAGAVAVLAIGLGGGSTTAVMWAGGLIGVLVGAAIAAASGREKKG
jgi:hypothetical protein